MRRYVYLAAAALGAVAFLAAHDWATARRGREAVGGEFLLLLLPLWVWVAARVAEDWRSAMRGARPCSRVRSRGPLALLGSVSTRRVMENCTYCPGKCEWYRERVRAARERLRSGGEKGDCRG